MFVGGCAAAPRLGVATTVDTPFKNYIPQKRYQDDQLVFESTPKNAPRLPIQNQQSYYYHTSLVNYIVEYVRTYSWM